MFEYSKHLRIDNITEERLNKELNVFRTSIGVSIIVEIPLTNQIILTRRSRNSAYSDNINWVYVSVTEAVSISDTHLNGKIDFKKTVERGLLEELGIDEYHYDKDSIVFYDMFFEKNFLQDGVTAVVKLNDQLSFAEIEALIAKDKKLEVDQVFTLNKNKKIILDYINKNNKLLRPQTIYTLMGYIQRM